MSLFVKRKIRLHSGQQSDFKIECDALTDNDWDCLAFMISEKMDYKSAWGVPEGGKKLAEALMRYRTADMELPSLICDDVLTTGNSMKEYREYLVKNRMIGENIKGIVIFARNDCPDWIEPLFTLNL